MNNTIDTESFLTKDYLNASCSVKSMSGELLAVGYISEIQTDYLELRNNSDRLPLIAYNTTVRLSVIHSKLNPYFGVGTVYVSSDDLLRIVDYSDVLSFERREAFRVELSLPGHVYRVPLPEAPPPLSPKEQEARRRLGLPDEIPPAPPDEKPAKVEMKDLSLTGAYFAGDRLYQIGERLQISFPLDGTTFHADCRIRRTIEEKDGRHGYGCMFVDLPRRMADKLCAYLYRKQGEQIRRVKEKNA